MIGSPEMNLINAKIANNQIELPFGNISTNKNKKINSDFVSTELMFGIRPNDISISNEEECYEAKIFFK